MNVRKSLVVGVAAVAAMGTSQIVSAVAASATSCTSNYVCLYQNSNYGGGQRNFSNTSSRNVAVNLTGGVNFNDQMSSWQSRRAKYSAWTFNTNAGGQFHCINPNWNVSQVTAPENDQASTVVLYVDSTRC